MKIKENFATVLTISFVITKFMICCESLQGNFSMHEKSITFFIILNLLFDFF